MDTLTVGGFGFSKNYSTLEGAILNAHADDIIVLRKDVTVCSEINKPITIDGQGHILRVQAESIGLRATAPLVVKNMQILCAPRSNGILFYDGGQMTNVQTRILEYPRVYYPTIYAQDGALTIEDCDIQGFNATAETTVTAMNSGFMDDYMGNVWIASEGKRPGVRGDLKAVQCTFIGQSFYGRSELTGCLLGAYNQNCGNMAIDFCKLAPNMRTIIPSDPYEDSPLRYKQNGFFAIRNRGNLKVNAYVSELPETCAGFYQVSGKLSITNSHNSDRGVHQITGGSLSIQDTTDMSYYDIQKTATSSIVRSNVKTAKTVESAKEKLDKLTGLTSVKTRLTSILNTVEASKNSEFPFSWHMIFAGDPGTGKTTVARLTAQALFEIGALPENKCTEVSVDTLIKGYVGQTAANVKEVLDKAVGGVLFIDEAYELAVKPGQTSFNSEALSVLLRYMEDHKQDLVVIAAGYEKEMKDFLASNPGLSRRFEWVTFEDYTPKEMADIFTGLMEKYHETWGSEKPLKPYLESMFEDLSSRYLSHPDKNGRTTNGGNAGMVRNVFQSVLMTRNDRVAEYPETSPKFSPFDLDVAYQKEQAKAGSKIPTLEESLKALETADQLVR